MFKAFQTYASRVATVTEEIQDLRADMNREQEMLASRSAEIQHAKEELTNILRHI